MGTCTDGGAWAGVGTPKSMTAVGEESSPSQGRAPAGSERPESSPGTTRSPAKEWATWGGDPLAGRSLSLHGRGPGMRMRDLDKQIRPLPEPGKLCLYQGPPAAHQSGNAPRPRSLLSPNCLDVRSRERPPGQSA